MSTDQISHCEKHSHFYFILYLFVKVSLVPLFPLHEYLFEF